MNNLSVLIITYNAEKHIRECLESVKWADEIVVVDAFSTDKTVEICKGYTNKIYQNKWPGYGPQRNFALSKCNGKWILSVDADEIVTPELRKEIGEVVAEERCEAYGIPRLGIFEGAPLYHGGWYPNYQKRLFKKGKAEWGSQEVHEELIVHGETGYLKNRFLHYSYDSIESFLERFNKYTTLSAEEMFKTSVDRMGKRINFKKGSYFGVLWFFLYHPLRWFGHRFFRLKGYKDGIQGLIYGILGAFYEFITRVKYWDKVIPERQNLVKGQMNKIADFLLRKIERVCGLLAEAFFITAGFIAMFFLFGLLAPVVWIRNRIEKKCQENIRV